MAWLAGRLDNVFTLLVLPIACVVLVCGCKPQPVATSQLRYDVLLSPSPPQVGPVRVTVTIQDAAGKAVDGAKIRVEGNMNHAGMKPSFADLREEQPGRYAGTLAFTMGGDWFLLITTTTPGGTKSEHKVDVPGVQSK